MKLPIVIKPFIAAALTFSLFGLFMQFVFSYLNQSVNGPQLTFVNFAGPFILTIAIILFFINRMFSATGLRVFDSTPKSLRIFFFILLALLLMWQLRYVVLYYGIKQGLDTFGFLAELFPMTAGFVVTFFIMLSIFKTSTSANTGFQQYRR